jgi:hypothetical protein
LLEITERGILLFGIRVEQHPDSKGRLHWTESGSEIDATQLGTAERLVTGLTHLRDSGWLTRLMLVRVCTSVFIRLYVSSNADNSPCRLLDGAALTKATSHHEEHPTIRIPGGLVIPEIDRPVDLEVREAAFCGPAEFYVRIRAGELMRVDAGI